MHHDGQNTQTERTVNPQRTYWLVAVAVSAFLGVLWLPMTSGFVRAQLRSLRELPPGVGASPFSSQVDSSTHDSAAGWLEGRSQPSVLATELSACAARNPKDYPAQVALAFFKTDLLNQDRVRQLEQLLGRYGSEPSLYAHILRYYTLGQMRIHRPELDRFFDPASPGGPDQLPRRSDIQTYLRVARDGERLDPENAYFPMMESAGLFANKQDAEGTAVLQRAATLSKWDDYAEAEYRARIHLYSLTYGYVPAPGRLNVGSNILLPHLSALRGAARGAIALAAHKEAAGNIQQGLAIRIAVTRCGSLMCLSSNTEIGKLVGIALAEMTSARPASAPRPGLPAGMQSSERSSLRWAEFNVFLERSGQKQLVVWFDRERTREQGVHSLVNDNSFGENVVGITVKGAFLSILDLWCLFTAGIYLLMAAVVGLRWKEKNVATPAIAVALTPLVIGGGLICNPTWLRSLLEISQSLDHGWIPPWGGTLSASAGWFIKELLLLPPVAAILALILLIAAVPLTDVLVRAGWSWMVDGNVACRIVTGTRRIGPAMGAAFLLSYAILAFAAAKIDADAGHAADLWISGSRMASELSCAHLDVPAPAPTIRPAASVSTGEPAIGK